MATLQAYNSLCSSSANSFRKTKYTLHNHKFQSSNLSVPKLLADEVLISQRKGLPITLKTTSTDGKNLNSKIENKTRNTCKSNPTSEMVQELYAILEIIADRIEMHNNICAQRDNWNHLLLTSVNGMTVTAALMAALGAINGVGDTLLVLKLSSSLLYMAVTGILLVMNKIQPSQLAEEQRNASRLFKQLYQEIKTCLALRNPTSYDVDDAIQKVLALDKAFPLPLLGVMLEKFPQNVEPAVWWPKIESKQENFGWKMGKKINGWNDNLEKEMKEVVGLVKRKDSAEYMRLSKLVLKVNRVLAISGPLLTGLAAVGSGFIGLSSFGSWPAILGVVVGALALVVNSLEHGGQVGMVFEMYRSSAGFYKHMEETIEYTLKAEKRENGELFEVKTALQLGRSLSELRKLASDDRYLSSKAKQAEEEFASKLF